MRIQEGLAVLIILGLSFTIGFLLERWGLRWFQKRAEHTAWKGVDLIVKAIKGWVWVWFALSGFHLIPIYLEIPEVFQRYLSRLFTILLILSFTVPLARLSGDLVNRSMSERIKQTLPRASVFVSLTRLLVFVIGVLIILHTLGISISPILAGLGIGSLAVALALQDTLSNLFSGLHLIASRQIRIGDYIQLESGESGYIVDITWRNVTLRELPNNQIVVPNNKLAQTIVKNFSLPDPEIAVTVEVTVSYNADLDKVERVTCEVAEETMRDLPEGVPHFKPSVRYHTFKDSGIQFTVFLRCRRYEDQFALRHQFIKKLWERYQKEGIEIPCLTRRIYLYEKEGLGTEGGREG